MAELDKETRMPDGWSLYKYDGQWREEKFSEGLISDAKLVIDLGRDGDTVTVAAASTDGVRYTGDYRYREGSNSNGDVRLERYRGATGDVFVGEWRESNKVRGEWIILVNSGRL